MTPVQVSTFHRGQRYQTLTAYTQDGIVLSRIYKGSTDAAFFESFIEQLLQHCGIWPEPKSVLIMDNASFHRSDRTDQTIVFGRRSRNTVLAALFPGFLSHRGLFFSCWAEGLYQEILVSV